MSARYSLGNLLGEGTYGKVFQATDLETNATVAVKRIKSEATAGNEGGFHFTSIREIKVMKGLKHDNLVSLLDIFVSDESVPSLNLVMPFLQMDLKQVIADRSIVLSMSHIKCIIKQVLSGLTALHSKWLLHRDLSPANVLVDTQTGLCKIADFGLARSFGAPYPGLLGRKRTFGGVMTSMVVVS